MNTELEQMTHAIVSAAAPEQVVLFGSRAQGVENASSDYDFALIFKSVNQARIGLRRANRALWPRRHPVDLVALTARSYANGSSVLAREVLATGRVLYGRT